MFIIVTPVSTGIKEAFNLSTIRHFKPCENGGIVMDVNGLKIEVKENFNQIIDQIRPKRFFN